MLIELTPSDSIAFSKNHRKAKKLLKDEFSNQTQLPFH